MTILMNMDILPGGCGVNNFYHFGDAYYGTHNPTLGGANLGVACFIDTGRCKQAYKDLAERFKIVYQSSVRKNDNSGNDFFMVVYDKKD